VYERCRRLINHDFIPRGGAGSCRRLARSMCWDLKKVGQGYPLEVGVGGVMMSCGWVSLLKSGPK
jgi:hypothetical protein